MRVNHNVTKYLTKSTLMRALHSIGPVHILRSPWITAPPVPLNFNYFLPRPSLAEPRSCLFNLRNQGLGRCGWSPLIPPLKNCVLGWKQKQNATPLALCKDASAVKWKREASNFTTQWCISLRIFLKYFFFVVHESGNQNFLLTNSLTRLKKIK